MEIRQIKFKAKRLDNDEWVEGDLIHLKDGVYICNDNGCNMAQVNQSTICQFTRLKDKDGKEVWEGDILSYLDEKVEVKYNTYVGGFTTEPTLYDAGHNAMHLGRVLDYVYLVVGNKFDKKESKK